MAVDDRFLDKFLFFQSELARNNYTEIDPLQYTPRLSGIDEIFCDLVIRKSYFYRSSRKTLKIFGGELSIENLCGFMDNNPNLFWVMTREFKLADDVLIYHMRKWDDATMDVTLVIKKTDFNQFLNYLFSYVDSECSKEWFKSKE